MTAPRTAREYRPAAWEPRHGVRRALACWALAWAIALAMLALWHSMASGEERPFPPSVALYSATGAAWCHAAPMGDGILTAKHCASAGILYIHGRIPPHSIDAYRDLAHLATDANAAIVLRDAIVGEALRWQNERGAGSVAVGSRARRDGTFTFTRIDGTIATHGESGTGLYGADGALVGVIVSLDFYTSNGQPSGTGAAVQVP